ncbi:MAG: hypothetical protein DLM61_20510, partial [Pseudonocardiales bacterium]
MKPPRNSWPSPAPSHRVCPSQVRTQPILDDSHPSGPNGAALSTPRGAKRNGANGRASTPVSRFLPPTRTSSSRSSLQLAHAFDLKRLGVLREVARGGSFAAAADALSFTPSAVSQQMATLERDAGTALFERTSQGTRLSVAGSALLIHADAVLARLAVADAELRAIIDGRGGSLRVGSFTSATTAFTALAVETFRERYPSVQVHFADGEPYESVARLRNGELDIAVVYDLDHWTSATDYDGVPVGSDLDLEHLGLFDDPFMVVLPIAHPLAASDGLSMKDIATEPILASSPLAEELKLAACQVGVELDIDDSYHAVGFEALQSFVLAGRGAMLMPRLALGWLRRDLTARPLEAGPVRHVKVAYPAATCRSPARAMRDIVEQVVGSCKVAG